MSDMAHRLKTSSATVGATALAERLRHLEKEASAGSLAETATLFADIEVEFERVRVELGDILANDPKMEESA